MVGTVKRWLGIDVLEAENLRLVRSVHALREDFLALDVSHRQALLDISALESRPEKDEDHEVRIAFLENSLTAKTSEAKIVPKAAKPNWKTFRTAAEKATEPQEITE